MTRIKESKNKSIIEPAIALNLTTEERIQFFANLIIDRIIEDQNNGQILYKKLTGN
jgi:hypothetical protein